MLVWMNKPTTSDQENIGFGPTKFCCGRKMKYGLNMMGECDSCWRLTWIEESMPGAATDFYTFDQSSLKKKMETEWFPHPGYCLFGDNAYVNTPYMCTPWRNVACSRQDLTAVEESGGNNDRSDELLDGGEHIDDHTQYQRRLYLAESYLPSYQILDYFIVEDLERPELSTQRLANNRNN
ncbi:hypothetical protein ACHAW6_002912 [Cyclotella cf. meneghiniana]